MKVCIVHEWLSAYAGSERVVEQLFQLFPDAVLYALVDFLPDSERGFLGGRHAKTSFIQRLPFARWKFRSYLPLMPIAIEQFDLSAYDIILSSNHAVAKGVLRGPNQLHISYLHTPIRYAWDLQHQYLCEAGLDHGWKSLLARSLLHYIRQWDRLAADRVDIIVANSQYIARRTWACYRRSSSVIHPPVDVDAFELYERKEDFYLAASRMVPYKRMPLIVEAFARMPARRLVVIGDGSEMSKVRQRAEGASNIEILGYQTFEKLRNYMQRARAFIFAAEEDFGITPVEAMACGTPVIAYGKGGVQDSVIPGETGIFFEHQTAESIIMTVERFEGIKFNCKNIREHAEVFRPERFRTAFKALVDREWEAFDKAHRTGQVR